MMKKIMWLLAMLPLIVTSVVLQFMPDVIPMHHDLEGNTDRWGNKTESLVFPVIILAITLFWHLLIRAFEIKAAKAATEKELTELKSSVKVLEIVGIAEAAAFGIMHYFILYSSYVQASIGGEKATLDIAKVSCFLMGLMLIVLGNYMPKAKKNAAVGLRTVWSMYNDVTWQKSNRFAAVSFVVAGLLTIVTTAFASGIVSTLFLLAYIIATTIVSVAYSKNIYDKEIRK